MTEEGFESFNVSQWDLDNEFNINRSTRRQTKNQSIYGIWAESESDDENESSKGKKRKDFTAPVSFVSGGLKGEEDKRTKNDRFKETGKKSKESKRPGFGTSQARGFGQNDASFGNWEMYTKGIGSKLLQKMGYQAGKGLGKNQQGIVEPIEAKKRQGSAALGFYGPEGSLKHPRKAEDVEKEMRIDDEEEEEDRNENWKKSGEAKAKPKKVKIYAMSTEEIIEESVKRSWSGKPSGELTGLKIIDMTRPEQRVLTGLSQLHQSVAEKPKSSYEVTRYNTQFDIPELRTNIDRLISLAERNLVKSKRDQQNDKYQLEVLSEEKIRLQEVLEKLKKKEDLQKAFSNFVEEIEEKVSDGQLSVEKALGEFESFLGGDDMKNSMRALSRMGLDDLILCTLGPLLRQEMRRWHPFSCNSLEINFYQIFERIKLISPKKTFEILLWETWNPSITRALQTWPSMKNFDLLTKFVERWRVLLPRWLYEHFVAHSLLPRLVSEVQSWDPLTDPVPLHSWIHPWLPIILLNEPDELRSLFEPIYEVIRTKLSNALTNWNPSDTSARLILEPWKDVMTEPSFNRFLEGNIVPKLEQALRRMTIDPNNQSLAEWDAVMAWRGFLPSLVLLLERHFVGKWLYVLYSWLKSGMADFDEVGQWYLDWKQRFGDELANHPAIKEAIGKALNMMDDVIRREGGLPPFDHYYSPNVTALPSVENHKKLPPEPVKHRPESNAINFRQMVEMKASEAGILFMPVANRMHQGRQVFQFGQHMIYIDNQVIFCHKVVRGMSQWAPMRLAELIEMYT